MINSRRIEDLDPKLQELAQKFKEECAKNHLNVLIYCTYRDNAFQDSLYAQGRTKPGKIVTKAKGGQSMHNYRVAFDAAPLTDGKPDWNNVLKWQLMGKCGRKVGLEWGGDWKFKDMPHFQYTGGLTLTDFQKGKRLP